jgi:hypothetical protein
MAYEIRDMTGSLFDNSARKEKDSHPDRSGTAMIDGREYWVNGWLKKDKNGKPWLSLAFKLKGEIAKPTTSKMQPKGAGGGGDMDDNIPFAPEWR